MEELSDILKHRNPQEPPEIAAIKRYIDENFHASASIAIQNENIVISVSSASLANTLRLRLTQLQSAANTERKLIFRIS